MNVIASNPMCEIDTKCDGNDVQILIESIDPKSMIAGAEFSFNGIRPPPPTFQHNNFPILVVSSSSSPPMPRHSYSSVLNVSIHFFIRIIQCRFHFPAVFLLQRAPTMRQRLSRRHPELITSLSSEWLSPFPVSTLDFSGWVVNCDPFYEKSWK